MWLTDKIQRTTHLLGEMKKAAQHIYIHSDQDSVYERDASASMHACMHTHTHTHTHGPAFANISLRADPETEKSPDETDD